MFIVSNFLAAIAKIIDIGLTLYMWIIIARGAGGGHAFGSGGLVSGSYLMG